MEKSHDNAVTLPPSQEAVAAMVADLYAGNEGFRAAFDRDPKAALAEYYKQELPPDMEIVVHRNEDTRWHVTLPSAAQIEAMRLSEADMRDVAGGTNAGPSTTGAPTSPAAVNLNFDWDSYYRSLGTLS